MASRLERKWMNKRIPSSYTFEIQNNKIRAKIFEPDSRKFDELIGYVRAFKGAYYDSMSRQWIIPNSEQNIMLLQNVGFNELKRSSRQKKVVKRVKCDIWMDYELTNPIPEYLRPYQVDGLRFLSWRGDRGGIIGDECGVGKTLQSIGYVDYMKYERVLFVVTSATKLQWASVIKKFIPWLDFQVLEGKTIKPITHKSVIVNWDILCDQSGIITDIGRFKPRGGLSECKFDLIIGDEIQYIGGHSSARTKAFRWLCKHTTTRAPIGMSGTPIKTCPAQFYDILALVMPSVFNNHMKFLLRYCDPKSNGFQMVYKGISNADELYNLVQPAMIRRHKLEVLTDMPPKDIEVVPIEPKNHNSYLKAEKEAFAPVSATRSRIDINNAIDALDQTIYEQKRAGAVEWIKEKLDNDPTKKLFIGVWHKPVGRSLIDDLSAYNPVLINGDVTGKQREDAKRKFIEDSECRVCVGNILASGVGIDGFQKVCSHVVTVEFAPSPCDHEQFEDRAWRSGQTEPVLCSYLVCKDTIDMDKMATLDERKKVIGGLIDGKDESEIDFYSDLLKKRGI